VNPARHGLIAVAAVLFTSTPVSAAPDLACKLSAPARVEAGQPVPLRLALTNRGHAPLRVLNWATPFEGWFGPYVQVMRDGALLRYAGPMVKRGDPGADEYVAIGAGRSRRAEVDLAQPFDFTQPGHYRVTPRITLFDVTTGAARPRAAHAPMPLNCPPLEIEVVAAR
jgi:uncharacterized protein (DUF58 family)